MATSAVSISSLPFELRAIIYKLALDPDLSCYIANSIQFRRTERRCRHGAWMQRWCCLRSVCRQFRAEIDIIVFSVAGPHLKLHLNDTQMFKHFPMTFSPLVQTLILSNFSAEEWIKSHAETLVDDVSRLPKLKHLHIYTDQPQTTSVAVAETMYRFLQALTSITLEHVEVHSEASHATVSHFHAAQDRILGPQGNLSFDVHFDIRPLRLGSVGLMQATSMVFARYGIGVECTQIGVRADTESIQALRFIFS